MQLKSIKLLKNINKQSLQNNIWTLFGAGAEAVYMTITVFLVVRLVGLAEAGVLSFSIAVSGLFRLIAAFNVRVFQSTDVNEEYSLNSYIGLRLVSSLAAVLSICIFLVISNFEIFRTTAILLVFAFFLTDGVADVFMGDLQQKGKMRIAGRMRVCAYGLSLVAFLIMIISIQDLLISLLASFSVLICTYIIWIWFYRREFKKVRSRFNMAAIKNLVKNALPLAIIGFISGYLYNSSKYFLGYLNTDETVAIITMLIMPVSLLSLMLSAFFAGAEMTKTAEIYAAGQPEAFSKRVSLQLLFSLAVVSAFCLFILFFGIPLLSWIFDVDLSQYKNDFVILILSCSAFYTILPIGAAIVVMRKQKQYMIMQIFAIVITFPFSWFLIDRYGITGAAFSYAIIYLPIIITSYILYRIMLKKLKPTLQVSRDGEEL